MGEPLTLALALRADRNSDEQGAINFIFAIFIAVALAFLFSAVVPLLMPKDSTIGEKEVLSALHTSDRAVVEIGSNGVLRLASDGSEKLRATIISIEKQVYGSVTGDLCAGVYKSDGSTLQTTAIAFKDAFNRPCSTPLAAVQARATAQAAALGANMLKTQPFFVMLYKRDSEDLALVQPALVKENQAKAAVTPAVPETVSPGSVAAATATPSPTVGNTPTSPPPTNTAVPTATSAPAPTKPVNLGSMGGDGSTVEGNAGGNGGVFQF